MSLIEYRLDGTINKVEQAIQRLRAFEPPDGYWVAYSGGKDSIVIKRLCEMAGVKHECHYSVTSVDPPELVRFIKEQKDVFLDIPRDADLKEITMWNLIPRKKLPPTRVVRYCCDVLKESSGAGRVTVTGVRWAESARRKNNRKLVHIGSRSNTIVYNTDNDEARRAVEACYRTRKTLVNPIIDWTDADVWEFIKTEKIPYCGLYDCGKKRLGCLGCPLSNNGDVELREYPKYKEAYLRAFDRMLTERKEACLDTEWTVAEEVYDWLYKKKSGQTNKVDYLTLFKEGR